MVLICWQQATRLVIYLIPLSHMVAACWIANCFDCHCMKMNIAFVVNFGYEVPTDF